MKLFNRIRNSGFPFSGPVARAQKNRRFHLEALEDRTLLTIFFTPQQGAETVHDGGGRRMGTVSPGMPLYTIYWGSWWTNTSAGQTLQAQTQNSLNSIFRNSGYLNGLNQYGVKFPAGVMGSGTVEVNNTSDPTNGFSDSSLQNVIDNAIDHQGLPDANTFPNEGLYVVFTPPGIHCSNPNEAGYHSWESLSWEIRHYAWVGDFGDPNSITSQLNAITTVLSHELIESMTDPNGNGITCTNGNELCDGEAQSDLAFINGYEVDSFWSQSDGAYAIYDGKNESVTVDNGNLIVNGGQLGPNHHDTINVDLNSDGGVKVTLDGESFSFPKIVIFSSSPEINRVTINTAGSNDTINILNTSYVAPVTINEGSGSGSDNVYISPYDKDLHHIQGAVFVEGGSGFVNTLTVDDQNDPANYRAYAVSDGHIDSSIAADIGYTGMYAVALNGSSLGAIYNVVNTTKFTQTYINAVSAGANLINVQMTTGPLYVKAQGGTAVIDVEDTSPGGQVQIDAWGSNNSVNVSPAAQNLDNILGSVTVDGSYGNTWLTIDDQNAPPHWKGFPIYNITASSISRSGTVNYNHVGVILNGTLKSRAIYNVSGTENSDQTILNSGTLGNTVDVSGNSGLLYVNSGGPDTVLVGANGNVQGIDGWLEVLNGSGTTTLQIDDSQDLSGRNVTLNTYKARIGYVASITGLAPAAIVFPKYGAVSTVTIFGGSGGNTFNVDALPSQPIDLNTGGGNDTVNLNTTSGSLVVNGQGGNNTLVGPDENETWNITGASAGNVAGASFSNFQNLTGGPLNDIFKLTSAGSVSGFLDGGGGTNTLDYSGDGGHAATVNLSTSAATKTGGFSNIEVLVGSTSTGDTLVGANTTNTWKLSGSNAGSVTWKDISAGGLIRTIAFSAFEDLTGGTGMDIFQFGAGAHMSGSINGSGGGDWLDYAAYTTPVAVNLQKNTATGVGGGVTNVQNVRGGQGGNTLIGNSLANILIGGAGANTIVGGTGRSILIGDKGAATITGNSGSDILIAGYTNYDTSSTANDLALEAILTEWQSNDLYRTRISKIKNGLNGGYKLDWGTTVFDNAASDANTLTGGGGAGGWNWFFAKLSHTKTNRTTREQLN
jgi:hypothetical protein